MASELFVDNITGKTGTSGSAPITLSGNAATLGSGVTFPTGHVIQVTSQPNSYPHALSGLSNRSSDLAVQSASSVDWELTLSNVIQGNKILITGMVQFSVDSANGNPAYKLQMKVGQVDLVKKTMRFEVSDIVP